MNKYSMKQIKKSLPKEKNKCKYHCGGAACPEQ